MSVFTEQAFLSRLGQHQPELRDDVALTPDGQLLTVDTLVEGVHFCWDYASPQDVGWKAIAVNASDIAATGGVLDGVLVALTLPQKTSSNRVDQLYDGMAACLATLPGQPPILGGDTTRGPCWIISVTAIGHLPAGYRAGRRWDAQVGDKVLTTGSHGLSAVGLAALQHAWPGYEVSRQAHLRPAPRWQQGLSLAQVGCRYALMDSSDGLADAALKIAEASNVGIELWADALPTHPEVVQFNPTEFLTTMLYGGEDFELLACWPDDCPVPTGFTPVGQVVTGSGAWIRTGDGEIKPLSHQHTFKHFSS